MGRHRRTCRGHVGSVSRKGNRTANSRRSSIFQSVERRGVRFVVGKVGSSLRRGRILQEDPPPDPRFASPRQPRRQQLPIGELPLPTARGNRPGMRWKELLSSSSSSSSSSSRSSSTSSSSSSASSTLSSSSNCSKKSFENEMEREKPVSSSSSSSSSSNCSKKSSRNEMERAIIIVFLFVVLFLFLFLFQLFEEIILNDMERENPSQSHYRIVRYLFLCTRYLIHILPLPFLVIAVKCHSLVLAKLYVLSLKK